MSNLYPATTVGNPNILINGDFQIWQRGTSFPTAKSGEITADRWKTFIENNTPSDALNIRRSSGRMLITGSNKRYVVYQYVELTDQIKTMLRVYKYLTASAMFVCNADMSIGMSVVLFKSSDGTQTNIGTITENFVNGKTKTIKFTCDVTGIDLTDYDLIQFNLCNVPADCASNNVYIYWGKLEHGEVATPYIPRPYTEELLLCKRYFTPVKLTFLTAYTVADGATFALPVDLHVPMRRVPDIVGAAYPLALQYRHDGSNTTFNATSGKCSKYGERILIVFKSDKSLGAFTTGHCGTDLTVQLDAEI